MSRADGGRTRGCPFGMACPDQLSSRQYAVWLVLWVGWNAFIICFYLEVGRLSQVTTGRGACLLFLRPSLPPSLPPSSFPLSFHPSCSPAACPPPPPSPAPQLCPPKRDPEPEDTPTLAAKHPPGCWGCLPRGSQLHHRAPRRVWDGQTDGSGRGGGGGEALKQEIN